MGWTKSSLKDGKKVVIKRHNRHNADDEERENQEWLIYNFTQSFVKVFTQIRYTKIMDELNNGYTVVWLFLVMHNCVDFIKNYVKMNSYYFNK